MEKMVHQTLNNKVIVPALYFGSIDYFILLYHSNKVLVEQFETYPKQTLRNRCQILEATKTLDLSIPVIKSDSKIFKNIEIDYSTNWDTLHQRAIYSCYKKSPFYDYYEPYIAELYEKKTSSLFEFNVASIHLVEKLLTLTFKHSASPEYIKDEAFTDYRNSFKPSKKKGLFRLKPYLQVFETETGFTSHLSILDLLFNLGPETAIYLHNKPTFLE
jgi:hypothetical protein